MSRADEREPELSSEGEEALLEALAAALRPQPLDAATNERLLALALEDPLAPPSAEELVESGRLRDALATGARHEAEPLLAALRAPFGDATADPSSLERALDLALVRRSQRAPRANVVYGWFGAASAALAAAAVIVLIVGPPRSEEPAATSPRLMRSRTTAALFTDRFETSATSERMDRIATARARDLRDNRYAAWGVR